MEKLNKKIICALDMHDLDEAVSTVKKLAPYVGAFKIGHALTLGHGLDVIDRLHDAGANRVFLDLKFHDIPNSVALAVREACRRGAWMITVHTVGGPAMMLAASEEAKCYPIETRPKLVGVSVLTSLDQHILTTHLGVQRTIEEQMIYLGKLAMDCELAGVVCSAHEVKALRAALGHEAEIVTPGIRLPNCEVHDQKRVGDALQTLEDGASYLVIGRALIQSPDIMSTLGQFGLVTA